MREVVDQPVEASVGDDLMANCPQCDAPLPDQSPLGVCPACLLEGGTRSGVAREEVDLGFLEKSERRESLGKFDGYEVVEVLGQGATGIVLKGEDDKLQRPVAIKVLHPVLATGVLARKRFLWEARAAAAVSHDHVVTTHAVGEWNGLPYLVMEFVAGRSLEDRLRADGPLCSEEILRIAGQVAGGLAAAHGQGLVHRDVKPANVLLENGVERVKLSDFGLVWSQQEGGVTLTGYVSGTPEYMSPEQAAGEPVDVRSDLYSLGALMYAMVTGVPPFRGKATHQVLRRVAEEEPAAFATHGLSQPAWLERMVLRLLAKSPGQRPQSAQEVGDWCATRLSELQRGEEPAEERPRSMGRWAAIAAVLIALVAGGWMFRGTGEGARKAAGEPPASTRVPGPGDAAPGGPIAPALADRPPRPLMRFLEGSTLAGSLGEPPPLSALAGHAWTLEHVIWSPRALPAPTRDETLDDVETVARDAGLDPGENGVFLVLITGDGQLRHGRPPESFLRRQLSVMERGREPSGGVWMGAAVTPEAVQYLPEDRRVPGIDVWLARPSAPAYDRRLFEALVSRAREESFGLRSTRQDRSLDGLLEKGELVYVGRRQHNGGPGPLDPHDPVQSALDAGVERAEEAAYILFVVDEDEESARVAADWPAGGMQARLDKFAFGENATPPAGLWIGSLSGTEGVALLPPDSARVGCEIWAIVPPEPPPGVLLHYDRVLFEWMLELARRSKPLAGTRKDETPEAYLAAGWEVVYLGRRIHDVPNPEGAPSIHHLVTTGAAAGLAEPEKAAYLLFSIDEEPTEWRVTHGISRFIDGIETKWERPDAGAWIGAVVGPTAVNHLPPDSRYPCFEFWALVPPEGE